MTPYQKSCRWRPWKTGVLCVAGTWVVVTLLFRSADPPASWGMAAQIALGLTAFIWLVARWVEGPELFGKEAADE